MYSKEELITPDIAREYLSHNTKNRNIRRTTVSNYARDMKNGEWQLSPQGISFYEDGTLADGQHRLVAIIEANVSVNMYVTRDVPQDSTIQDRGIGRSSSDIFRMAGYEGAAYGTQAVSLVNVLFDLAGHTYLTDNIRLSFLTENEEYIKTAIHVFGRGNKATAICRKSVFASAAFCALVCGIPEDCLSKFFEVANTGFQNSQEESAAIVLRNAILQNEFPASRQGRVRAFAVSTNAIKDFSQSIPRTRIYRKDQQPVFFDYVKQQKMRKYISSYSGVSKKAIHLDRYKVNL